MEKRRRVVGKEEEAKEEAGRAVGEGSAGKRY